jgi:hypothetical protein
MRNLFLLLLLANLLLFAWLFWVEPAAPGDTRSTVARLELYRGPPGTAGSAVTAPTDAGPASPVSPCVRVGPWIEDSAMQQARELLNARGFRVVAEGPGQESWLGLAVRVPGFVSRSAAETARAQLLAGGLPEVVVTPESGGFSLNLGVFRDQDGVDRVVEAARSAGLVPRVSDRYRPDAPVWLVLTSADGQPLRAAALKIDEQMIFRAESTACPPEQPVVPAPSSTPGAAAVL